MLPLSGGNRGEVCRHYGQYIIVWSVAGIGVFYDRCCSESWWLPVPVSENLLSDMWSRAGTASSSAVKLSIGSTIGFHINGEGPY